MACGIASSLTNMIWQLIQFPWRWAWYHCHGCHVPPTWFQLMCWDRMPVPRTDILAAWAGEGIPMHSHGSHEQWYTMAFTQSNTSSHPAAILSNNHFNLIRNHTQEYIFVRLRISLDFCGFVPLQVHDGYFISESITLWPRAIQIRKLPCWQDG